MARKDFANLLSIGALVIGGLALILALGLTGCSPSTDVAAKGYGEAQPLVDQVKADLAAHLDVAVEDVVVERVEATEFPDASLGVPEPGQMVAQVVTHGYVIVLAVDGAAYEYHAADERVVLVPAAEAEVPDPGVVVESFYRWYLDYPGNALADGTYRASEFLTAEFVGRVDEIIASFDKGGYDPFLCAQDIPGDLAVGEPVISGETASVVVRQTWNPGTEYAFTHDVTVSLALVDGGWKIAGIACEAPEPAPAPLPEGPIPTTPEGAVQGFYSWYLWYARNVGNPLADGAYRSSEYLTRPFIEKVDEIITSFDKGGYDPFLCAQDIPERFAIDVVELVDNDTARVVVSTSFEGHALTLSLIRMGERWAIDDVACSISAGEETAAWQVLADEAYGFQMRFPADWAYEDLPPAPAGMEVPEGMHALKRVLVFAPQGWDGVAPPVNVEVVVGDDKAFRWLYVPPTSSETLDINGYAVVREIEDIGGVRVIRTIFISPADENVRVVVTDYISGFPERVEGHEHVIGLIQQMLTTFKFVS
jgi:hypothetical protein